MRSSFVAVSLALLSVGVFAQPVARAGITLPYSSLGREPVAVGVAHDWGVAGATSGEQQIHMIEIDPTAPGISLETGLPNDRVNSLVATTTQALSNSSDGHRVVAAINGDIYGNWAIDQAAALGLTIRHGELITSGEPRPAFGVDAEGDPIIGMPTVTMSLALPDSSTVPINRLNQRRLPDQIVLYTPRFDSHTWTDASGTEVVLTGAPPAMLATGTYPLTVSEVRTNLGDSSLASGQWVLSGAGLGSSALSGLSAGDELVVSVSIDAAWQDAVHAIGGPELLVQQGVVDVEPYREHRATGVNPRTALGLKADGTIFLVTVDGRSPLSGGLKLADTAELMRSLGAVEALNLDGGGSTTMAVRRLGDVEVSVANRPSSGFERNVNTTLHVVSATPTGPTTNLLVSPAGLVMPVGGSRQFIAKGHDEAFNGTTVDPGEVSWSTVGDAATVDDAGLVEAISPGEVTLRARLGPIHASAQVTVSSDANPPSVSVPEVKIRTGGAAGTSTINVDLSWSASDGEGPLAQLELEQSVDGGGWASIALAKPTVTTIGRELRFRRGYQYRLLATDGAGNQTEMTSPVYRVVPYNEVAPEVEFAGTWSVQPVSSAIANGFGRNDVRAAPGATASLEFVGRQVAWIGPGGAKRGQAQVSLDGAGVAQVNAYRATKKPRRVLYVSPATLGDGGTHSIELRNVSAASKPFVDLDAFLVLVAE